MFAILAAYANFVRIYYMYIIKSKERISRTGMDGRFVKSGGPELALQLEEKGYEWLETAAAAPVA